MAAVNQTRTLDTNEKCSPLKSLLGSSVFIMCCSPLLITQSIPFAAARLNKRHVQLRPKVMREERQHVNNMSPPLSTNISLNHRGESLPKQTRLRCTTMVTASWCFSAACRHGDRAQTVCCVTPAAGSFIYQ